jgi:ADP-ribosylglycohydrolase
MLVVADGDYRPAVLGGVNYGRDSDSIATMAGAISGAMRGLPAIPADWAVAVADASRLDLRAPGQTMAAVAREVFERDSARERRQATLIAALHEAGAGVARG